MIVMFAVDVMETKIAPCSPQETKQPYILNELTFNLLYSVKIFDPIYFYLLKQVSFRYMNMINSDARIIN